MFCDGKSYEWIDSWAKIPDTESARTGWAHHGIVVTEAGEVLTYHPGESRVLVLDDSGNLARSWPTTLVEGHGMTLVKEGETEYLWMVDNGSKEVRENNYAFTPESVKLTGQIVKMGLDGRTLMKLPKPRDSRYEKGSYSPTSVAINEERFGGNGDIWVADGYGLSLVHRYNRRGDLLDSIDGTEGSAGRFYQPHCLYIDRRKAEPELYIADRENRRIQVYSLEGRFKRTFGSDFLTSPSGFASHAGFLFVAELRARVAVLDTEDKLVGYLGRNEGVCDEPGWPNRKDEDGRIVPTDRIRPGKFNSPHGIAADRTGNVFVAEWLIGGRIVKLQSLSDGLDQKAARSPQALSTDLRPRGTTGMTEAQEGVAERFNRISEVYDETREPLSDSAMDKIAQVLSAEQIRTILEAGIGTGRIAKPLQVRGFDIVGVDFARRMLARARHKGLEDLVIGDANHLPFEDKSFDAVILAHVLHLLKSPAETFGKLSQAAKKEVVILVRKRDQSGGTLPWQDRHSGALRQAFRTAAEDIGYPLPLPKWDWRDRFRNETEFLLTHPPTELVTVQDSEVVTTPGEWLSMVEKRAFGNTDAIPPDVFKKIIEKMKSSVDLEKEIRYHRVEQMAVWHLPY